MFNWNKKDKEIFGEMASSLLISGLIGGNPFVVIASLVTMARAYNLHKKKKGYNFFTPGFKKGSFTSSLFIGIMYVFPLRFLARSCDHFLRNHQKRWK